MKKNSVCYVLSYYSPRYVRTETLIQALKKINGIKLHEARNTSTGFLRYFQTVSKLIAIRALYNPQYYILGFRGYEFFWVIRLVTLGKTLIYDHMMSPYDSLRNEQSVLRKGGLIDMVIYYYEKSVLFASDLVLTDTEIHRQYFCELFGLPLEKIEAIPIGTDEDLFQAKNVPTAKGIDKHFEVLYYGSFLPLHGMDIILRAAALLLEKPIHFILIGGNRLDLSDFHNMVKSLRLNNVTHIDWVEFDELPAHIARSDLGLGGPFGKTGQAGRVITGKTFQFLAMAKPTIVGIRDEDDGFEDKVNCLLVPRGNEEALASAILWAFEHKEKLNRIGQLGYDLYRSRYSIEQIAEKMKKVIPL
jgi:glycosyltransferase involved in cell wall biosynthesis